MACKAKVLIIVMIFVFIDVLQAADTHRERRQASEAVQVPTDNDTGFDILLEDSPSARFGLVKKLGGKFIDILKNLQEK
ncbi:unnamed protein product [Parnassius apollo]|uniref:(apollo) hypothetical protein n=1 Tax=Parnassius apollo TaxID=110799 RepID=A0A8S3Y6Z7_PARAO|nr:unnamed protein product [Parnassius apollo]